jgi:GNAT superfamily N-acetyltransferase
MLVQNQKLSDKIDEIQEGFGVNTIRIEKVTTKKDLKAFIKFPWEVYKDDPNWVPPLIMDVKEKLDKKKNPFFEHSEMELFLAYKDGKITGRIAAIVDDNHNEFHEEKVVFFGMYECFDDLETTQILLDKVAAWGLERGMDTLRGPMNLSMNDECAFLLEGFDSPPMIMMTYNPRYYLDLMEQSGLVKAKDLYAFYMDATEAMVKKIQGIVNKIKKKTNVTLRSMNMKKIDEEVEKIKYVYNNGWEKNWGFVPWTENEMDHMAKKLKTFSDPDIIIIAEEKGKPVGFAFALPNYNEVLIKLNGRLTPIAMLKFLIYRKKIESCRAIVFGILEEYRQTGLSYLLYDEFEKNVRRKGYKWGETSWQLEDNDAINRFVQSIGGEVYKKYRIYEKSIS